MRNLVFKGSRIMVMATFVLFTVVGGVGAAGHHHEAFTGDHEEHGEAGGARCPTCNCCGNWQCTGYHYDNCCCGSGCFGHSDACFPAEPLAERNDLV